MDRMPPASVPMDPWHAARVWRWYTTRYVRGGHAVGCELRLIEERDEDTGELLCDQRLIAVMDGRESELRENWPRGWPWKAVPEPETLYLAALSTWAKANDPNH